MRPPAFEGKTSDDLVTAHVALSAAHTDCADRHNGLVEALSPLMIVCDFCLKRHVADVLLVESYLKNSHICEKCLDEAVELVE